jgi:protein-S-isoprenylcysteine O-methyltransferase Ste14
VEANYAWSAVKAGSYAALTAFALFEPLYVLRIKSEEKLLHVALPGCTEYCEKTLRRMLPGIQRASAVERLSRICDPLVVSEL